MNHQIEIALMSSEKPKKLFYKKEIKPITMRYLLLGIVGVFNIESGFTYTIYSFLKKPGKAFVNFLGKDRYRFANPFRLAFIITAIATFLTFQLNVYGELNEGFDDFQEGYNSAASTNQFQEIKNDSAIINQFFKDYSNIFLLISIPVLAIFSFLFYRKRGYNYAEHLVLNTFIYSITTLFYIILIFFISLADWVNFLYLILSVSYTIYAYMSVLKGSVFRALLCQLVSYFVYLIFVIFISGVIFAIKLGIEN